MNEGSLDQPFVIEETANKSSASAAHRCRATCKKDRIDLQVEVKAKRERNKFCPCVIVRDVMKEDPL